jgi:N-acetylglucosaminyldiphosphoundecaprenol N-acetyl-beta-D-mannosaminyltransferase
MRTEILSYPVWSGTIAGCRDEIAAILGADRRDCRWLACLNPHSYVIAKGDPEFAAALRAADWLLPDGVGIAIAARILGRQLPGRITGFDIFEAVMTLLDARGGSVFFLGTDEATLAAIAARMRTDYPAIRLAGCHAPPFAPDHDADELARIVEGVNRSAADVLWVGMTAPKQEKLILRVRDQLDVRLAGAIGAVFDFYAGRVPRPHPAFRQVGLEWLPRLLREPRRLWRRMAISAPLFLLDLARARAGSMRRAAGTRDDPVSGRLGPPPAAD